MMTDPIRLLDDPTMAHSLRADLAHAEAAGLQGFNAAAGAAGLKAAIAAEGAATATAAGAGAGKGLALGLAGALTVGAIAWWALRSPEPPQVPNVAAQAPVADTPSAGSHQGESETQPEPEAGPREPRSIVPPPPLVEPKPAVSGVESPTDVEPPADAVEPPSQPKAKRPAPPADPMREAKLISKARRSMRTEPKRALALLQQAKSEFPRGLLREEREALTVLTLHSLGRTEKARAAAKRFLDAHAQSPHGDAIRQVLE